MPRVLRTAWRGELVVLVGLMIGYNVVRGMGGDDAQDAVVHAWSLVHAEGSVLHWFEKGLNTGLVHLPVLAVVACYAYALLHYAMTPLVLLRSRAIGGPAYWRGYWSLVIASGIALVIYALYPVAPPRLMPELHIVDVLRHFSQYGWWGSAASAPRGIGDATNQYAAMPSMHCGWALWCGLQMWGFGGRIWRTVAVAYPTSIALIVIATGNHFVLDVLAGMLCVLVAHEIAAWLPVPRLVRPPVELRERAGMLSS
jgi:hypothetical protein